MPDLQTIVDVPALTLEAGDLPTSRIPVAKLGAYKDKRYGAFGITDQHLQSWQRNLTEHFDGRAPIDFDHSPEKGAGTRAAGWITSVERCTGAELQAEDPKRFAKLDPAAVYAASTVEWSKAGAEAIRNREYAYISPTFPENWTDEGGVSRGSALIGAGLTNRPFLRRGMPAISLSDDVFQEPAEETPTESDSRGRMSHFAAIAKRLGLAEDADEAKILEQLPDNAAGVKVLTAEEYAGLLSRATAGDTAVRSLADNTFEAAWKRALEDPKGPRVTPAQEGEFKQLADLNLELAVKTLDGLPQVAITTKAKGEGTPTSLGADPQPGEVDEDRQDLHDRAVTALSAQGVHEDDPKFLDAYKAQVHALEAAGAR